MLDDLIRRCRDTSKDVGSAARSELAKAARSGSFSMEDAVTLLNAATEGTSPAPTDWWEDPSLPFLNAAISIANDNLPERLFPTLKSVFPRLTPAGKAKALKLVVMMTAPEVATQAAKFYLTAVLGDADFGGAPIPTYEANVTKEVASTLFPDILPAAERPANTYFIFEMLLAFRTADLLPPTIAKPFHSRMAAVLRSEVERARPFQRSEGIGWRDEGEYATARNTLGIMFDACGHLESKAILGEIIRAGDLLDPRLRRFRAFALLLRGVQVPDDELEWIARSPRDRYWLFDQLKESGFSNRLPPQCRDQTLLAEGAMVDWLCFGTELGREPDEIEFIHRETRNQSTGPRLISWMKKRKPVDYYFFKFRVTEEHWSKEAGWTVGMAGGYARDAQPTTSHDGGTFSSFAKLGDKPLKQHVDDYLS